MPVITFMARAIVGTLIGYGVMLTVEKIEKRYHQRRRTQPGHFMVIARATGEIVLEHEASTIEHLRIKYPSGLFDILPSTPPEEPTPTATA